VGDRLGLAVGLAVERAGNLLGLVMGVDEVGVRDVGLNVDGMDVVGVDIMGIADVGYLGVSLQKDVHQKKTR